MSRREICVKAWEIWGSEQCGSGEACSRQEEQKVLRLWGRNMAGSVWEIARRQCGCSGVNEGEIGRRGPRGAVTVYSKGKKTWNQLLSANYVPGTELDIHRPFNPVITLQVRYYDPIHFSYTWKSEWQNQNVTCPWYTASKWPVDPFLVPHIIGRILLMSQLQQFNEILITFSERLQWGHRGAHVA